MHAGTVNVGAPLVVTALRTGGATRLGRLLDAVRTAAARKAPSVQLADALVGSFVAVVLTLAAATAGLWLWLDPGRALDHTVALLVVTCPCALGLATPLAVAAAMGRAARRGLLIKGGDALEAFARPGLLLFDKTGTLTEGRLDVVLWHGAADARELVAAAEEGASHPTAQALLRAAGAGPALAATAVQHVPGAGVRAVVAGQDVVVGAPAFVAEHACATPEAIAWIADVVARGLTPVVVAVDGQIVAVVGLGDRLRSDARASLDILRAAGWRLGILSGDHPTVVAGIAHQLGLDPTLCRGGATPEAKLAAIERLRATGPVVMVGDGANDAAALAAATVGIAVHGGAEASLRAADAFTTRPGVAPVVELLAGARRTLAVVRWNIGFALVWNVVGAALAMAGLLHPIVAAVLMPIGSFAVVARSYRTRTFPSGADRCVDNNALRGVAGSAA